MADSFIFKENITLYSMRVGYKDQACRDVLWLYLANDVVLKADFNKY